MKRKKKTAADFGAALSRAEVELLSALPYEYPAGAGHAEGARDRADARAPRPSQTERRGSADAPMHRPPAGEVDLISSFPDPLDRTSLIECLRYEIDCEDYDRTLPGVWLRPGEWMPVNDGRVAGRTLSLRFARQRREELDLKLRMLEIPKEVWEPAQRYAQGLSYTKAIETLAALLANAP